MQSPVRMRRFFVTAIILRLVSLFSRQDQALTGAQTPLHGEALNMASETSIFPAVGVTLSGSAIRSSRALILVDRAMAPVYNSSNSL
jgi:hypothetical protein